MDREILSIVINAADFTALEMTNMMYNLQRSCGNYNVNVSLVIFNYNIVNLDCFNKDWELRNYSLDFHTHGIKYLHRLNLETRYKKIIFLDKSQFNSIAKAYIEQIHSKIYIIQSPFYDNVWDLVLNNDLKKIVENNQVFSSNIIDQKIYGNFYYDWDDEIQFRNLLIFNKQDVKWKNLKDMQFDIVLPGYASGDRYILGFLLILDVKVKIHIVYDPSIKSECDFATEAYEFFTLILKHKGIDYNNIVGLNTISKLPSSLYAKKDAPWNKPLDSKSKDGCQLWNENELAKMIKNIAGMNYNNGCYKWHISLSSLLISVKYAELNKLEIENIRNFLFDKCLSISEQNIVQDLYNKKFSHIENSILLWINNRDGIHEARVASYCSRPSILYQIKRFLNDKNLKTVFVGDSFKFRDLGFMHRDEINADTNPLIEFWNLLPRNNSRIMQWYLMHLIMSKNYAIIGNRSGAFTGLSLLEMPVINLEDKSLFSRDRDGQLVGRVPTYFRLTTNKPIGYKNPNPNDTEIYTDLDLAKITKRIESKYCCGIAPKREELRQYQVAQQIVKEGFTLNKYELDILGKLVDSCVENNKYNFRKAKL